MGATLGEAWIHIFGDTSGLDKDLGEAEKKTESSAGSMAKMLGGLVAGAAVAAGAAIIGIGTEAFNVASDVDAATDQIAASLGVNGDKAKAFGQTIKSIYANNFGDSIKDVGAAVENVAKQLQLTGDDPALQTMTENAFRLRDVFGVDVADSVSAAKTLMEQFGLSGEESFDMIAKGYEVGLDRSGDFLDTIGEYSVQFAAGGATAQNFFSMLEDGLQGGMLGTDKAADAFKEFRVRIQDGSDLTKNSLTAIGIDADAMAAKFADGSITAVDAFTQVTRALQNVDDKNVQFQAGVGLIGTQFEDLASAGAVHLETLSDNFSGLSGTVAGLDSKYTNLGSAIEGMWRQFQVGIEPAGEMLLAFVNENLPAFQGGVTMVTGAITTTIAKIPEAFALMRKAWDDDWAGMKTTATKFHEDTKTDIQTFLDELNNIFDTGVTGIKFSWEDLFRVVLTVAEVKTKDTLSGFVTFLKLMRGEQDIWSSLFSKDWEGTWEGIKFTWNTVVDAILDDTEHKFGPEMRTRIANGLNAAWDTIKEVVGNIKDWWQSAWSWLHLPDLPGFPSAPSTGGGGSGGFSGSGFSVPEFNMPSLTPGNWPISASAAAGTVNHIQVNTTGGYENGYAAGEGIVDAMRFRGH